MHMQPLSQDMWIVSTPSLLPLQGLLLAHACVGDGGVPALYILLLQPDNAHNSEKALVRPHMPS